MLCDEKGVSKVLGEAAKRTDGKSQDVSFDVVAVLSFSDLGVGDGSAVDDCLSVAVRKLDGRAARVNRQPNPQTQEAERKRT